MRSFMQATALIAFICIYTVAHPTEHTHKHRRQAVDWSNPALYKDVNWKTINYGPPAASPAPAPAPPPSNPAPAPVPVSAPVQQKNTNQNPPAMNHPTSNSGGSGAGPTSSGGKRGLAYNTGNSNLDLFDGSSSIAWAYNWDSAPGNLPSKFQFVPLLFSGESMHSAQWASKVAKATGPTKYLMSFNEPDQTTAVGGSNIAVGAAVAAWRQYMAPYASQGYKLGSPAVSNGQGTNPATGQPMGLDWLKPFLEQCSGCPIAFAPVHWYGCTNGCPVQNDIDSFKQTVQAAMTATKLPVWVTEFQCKGDAATFLNEVLPWLDGQQGVERYSYFMASDGILLNGNSLSQLGQTYVSK